MTFMTLKLVSLWNLQKQKITQIGECISLLGEGGGGGVDVV